jgi:hypothetical protein
MAALRPPLLTELVLERRKRRRRGFIKILMGEEFNQKTLTLVELKQQARTRNE